METYKKLSRSCTVSVELKKVYDTVSQEWQKSMWGWCCTCMRTVRVTYGFEGRGGTTSGVCSDVCNGNWQADRRGQARVFVEYDVYVICSESREQVEEGLERWRDVLERKETKVSRCETDYICVKVYELKYLRSTIQSNGQCTREVRKRVQARWSGWRLASGVKCERRIAARVNEKIGREIWCMVWRQRR